MTGDIREEERTMANTGSWFRGDNASRQPKMISVADALARYGIGRTKLYSLIGEGRIRAVKLGFKTLIDVEIADKFFDGLPSLSEKGDRSV